MNTPIGLYASEFIGGPSQSENSSENKPSKVNQLLNRINGKRRVQTPRHRPSIEEPLTMIDDGDTEDYNFNPPQHPISVGVQQTKETNGDFPIIPNKIPASSTDFGDVPDLDMAYADNGIPSTAAHNSALLKGYPSMSSGSGSGGDMIKKLDYMIHMMEEQRDQKTGHVAEELILYSFVGIFIIFTIDSFTKVGTYSR